MSKVFVVYTIYPEDSNIDLDILQSEIIKSLPSDVKVQSVEKKPVAFGLSAIKLSLIAIEREGIIDCLESAIQCVNGVGSVSADEVSLL